jgi:DNA polymerase III subunit epsilon
LAKFIYWDTETTGRFASKHDIVQLAYVIEIDGVIKEEESLFMAPIVPENIDEEALKVHSSTKAQIMSYAPAKGVFKHFVSILAKYINRYDKTDKFHPVGYNVRFDCEFVKAWFEKMGDKYYGSWFSWQMVDPLPVLHFLSVLGKLKKLPDYKLGTVCEAYQIPLGQDAHDALADVKAVKALVQKLDAIL